MMTMKQIHYGVRVTDDIIENNYMLGGERNPHKSYGYLKST